MRSTQAKFLGDRQLGMATLIQSYRRTTRPGQCCAWSLRTAPGGMPTTRLKARLNAGSDW